MQVYSAASVAVSVVYMAPVAANRAMVRLKTQHFPVDSVAKNWLSLLTSDAFQGTFTAKFQDGLSPPLRRIPPECCVQGPLTFSLVQEMM